MRILHTSDWHVGKVLKGQSRVDDHIAAQETAVYAYSFEHGRFDVGNKLDYLKATVTFALERDDVGPGLRSWLTELAAREGLA